MYVAASVSLIGMPTYPSTREHKQVIRCIHMGYLRPFFLYTCEMTVTVITAGMLIFLGFIYYLTRIHISKMLVFLFM